MKSHLFSDKYVFCIEPRSSRTKTFLSHILDMVIEIGSVFGKSKNSCKILSCGPQEIVRILASLARLSVL